MLLKKTRPSCSRQPLDKTIGSGKIGPVAQPAFPGPMLLKKWWPHEGENWQSQRAAQCLGIERDGVQNRRVLEQQRHEVHAGEAATEPLPRVELGLGEARAAPARCFIAGQGVEQRRGPQTGRALCVAECGHIEGRHEDAPGRSGPLCTRAPHRDWALSTRPREARSEPR